MNVPTLATCGGHNTHSTSSGAYPGAGSGGGRCSLEMQHDWARQLVSSGKGFCCSLVVADRINTTHGDVDADADGTTLGRSINRLNCFK